MQNGLIPRQLMPWIIILAAVGIAALGFILPVAATVAEPTLARTRTVAALFVASLFVGAAAYIIWALQSFTIQFRMAYRLVAVGVILLALGMVQLPLFGLFDMWDSAWVQSGGVVVPFMASLTVVYAGLRYFVHLLQIRTRASSFGLAAFTAVVFAVASTLFAGAVMTANPEGMDIYIGVVGWVCVFSAYSLVLVIKVSRTIGEHYRLAMRRLAVAVSTLLLAAISEYVCSFFFNNGDFFVDSGLYLFAFVPTALSFVWAGQTVRLLVPSIADAPTDSSSPRAVTNQDFIDSITSAAGLASQPQLIDPLLDDLREITARSGIGTPFSDQERQRLLATYHKVEGYLAIEDPVRHLPPSEVRQHVTPAFRLLLTK